MKKANIVVGILGLLLGLYVVITAASFPENRSAVDPGAAYFPTIMGTFVAILCVALIIFSLMGKGADINDSLAITPGMKRAALGVVLFVIYGLLFKPVGFLIDTAVFCFVCMYLLQNRRYVKMTITSVLTSAVIYIIFAQFLGAKLPAGLLKGIL